MLDEPQYKANVVNLLNEADHISRAHLFAVTKKELFQLQAVPTPTLGMLFNYQTFCYVGPLLLKSAKVNVVRTSLKCACISSILESV